MDSIHGPDKPKIGIIGSGIAGLGAAYLLQPHAHISVFEKDSRIGGHSNTLLVPTADGGVQPIDTGFMVYNDVTYPNLCQLFKLLDVKGVPTDMSFSVHHQPDNVTWCGSSLNQIFGQRSNVFRPSFWKMVTDLNRLCDEAENDLSHPDMERWTIRDYIQHKHFSNYLTRWFMLPMASAIWSTHPERILDFPARTLLRFYQNHRFLRLGGHLQWYTVPGGSRTYVQRMVSSFETSIQQSNGAAQVWQEHKDGRHISCVKDDKGIIHEFDAVILACHADEALALLADPIEHEVKLLSQFPYEHNTAVLHTDESVLPPIRRCWAAWNYSYTQQDSSQLPQAATHYWMNRLQHISGDTQYVVSINGEAHINPRSVVAEIAYTHPRFTLDGIALQSQLPALNGSPGLSRFYCGSYFNYGFHEDAFSSAIGCVQSVVEQLSKSYSALSGLIVWP